MGAIHLHGQRNAGGSGNDYNDDDYYDDVSKEDTKEMKEKKEKELKRHDYKFNNVRDTLNLKNVIKMESIISGTTYNQRVDYTLSIGLGVKALAEAFGFTFERTKFDNVIEAAGAVLQYEKIITEDLTEKIFEFFCRSWNRLKTVI